MDRKQCARGPIALRYAIEREEVIGMETYDLLTIEEAAQRMTDRGLPFSVSTLRQWRRTWPDSGRKGPMPLLISPRRLRYRIERVDQFIDQVMADTEQAIAG